VRKYPVPSVRAYLYDAEGRTAWVPDGAGELRLPGGPLKGGETWEEALRNRVREQVGLTVDPGLELSALADPEQVDGEWRLFAEFKVAGYRGEIAPGVIWKKWRESPQ
jgi:ADP-ribose pyrophosphatase YjhB (NUDIX family)